MVQHYNSHANHTSRPQQIDRYDDHQRVLNPVDGGLQRQLPAVRLGEHERQQRPVQVHHLYPEEGRGALLRLVTGQQVDLRRLGVSYGGFEVM